VLKKELLDKNNCFTSHEIFHQSLFTVFHGGGGGNRTRLKHHFSRLCRGDRTEIELSLQSTHFTPFDLDIVIGE